MSPCVCAGEQMEMVGCCWEGGDVGAGSGGGVGHCVGGSPVATGGQTRQGGSACAGPGHGEQGSGPLGGASCASGQIGQPAMGFTVTTGHGVPEAGAVGWELGTAVEEWASGVSVRVGVCCPAAASPAALGRCAVDAQATPIAASARTHTTDRMRRRRGDDVTHPRVVSVMRISGILGLPLGARPSRSVCPPPDRESSRMKWHRAPATVCNAGGTASLWSGPLASGCASRMAHPHRMSHPLNMRGRTTRYAPARPSLAGEEHVGVVAAAGPQEARY